MKKLVFSSICVAALSSSAFAADLVFTGENAKEWYEQVISSGSNVGLDTLGWTAGKDAIGATIGGASANDATTIVGSFVKATGTTQFENTYVKSGNDALKVSVKDLATSNKAKINATTMIQDYQKVEAQLKLASAASDIYNALSGDNKKVTGLDGSNTKYTLDDKKDNIDAIARALVSLGTDEASLKENDKFALAKVQTALDGMFGSSKKLNDYASAMADAGADKTKLETMKTDIKSNINSLVNAIEKAEDKALAKHIQAQLNDALAMFDKYTKADEQITKLEDKVTKAEEVVNTKFSTLDAAYQGVAKNKEGDALTTKAEIQKNISVAGDKAMNTAVKDADADKVINEQYTLSASEQLSLKQAMDYIDKKVSGDVADAIGSTAEFKTKDKMKAVIQKTLDQISKGEKLTITDAQLTAIGKVFKANSEGDAILLSKDLKDKYNAAITALDGVTDKELQAIIAANAELDALYASLASSSIAGTLKTNEINKALGELKSIAPAQAKELAKLFVAKDGTAITAKSITTDAETEFSTLSKEEKAKIPGKNEDEQKENYAKQKVAEHNAKIQTVANKIAQTVADSKKDAVMTEALSTLNIQLNNMNKRMGELRGLDGDAGVWLRTWGGKMSNDASDFTYYSTQLGADKKSSLKNGDLYLGLLTGFDKANSDVKSTSYSFGAYGSYISNNGFFADGVMKFITTSHDRSGYDIAKQKSFLASFEGGYRFDLSDTFYVEPSLEFITGRIGEYSSKKDNVTISVDAFSPAVFKPQAFVGGAVDAFTYRAGVGAVLTAKEQTANVEIKDIITDLSGNKLNANGSTKLGKNNHGFVSLGTSYKATENLRINLGLERSFGGDITNDYEVNATVRYGF